MAKMRKTWRQKLEVDHLPKVVATPKGKMLIPKPLDVDALIRCIPQGKVVTVEQIRGRLARDCNANFTCPLTTGIFLRIAAEAAEEDLSRGIGSITPYWRVVKSDGSLNEKFPGGIQAQAVRLLAEGHAIEPGKGKKPPRVKDFSLSLYSL